MSQFINSSGGLENHRKGELKFADPIRGRGNWASNWINNSGSSMVEINITTYWSGYWSIKNESGAWDSNGTYGSQDNACHNFSNSGQTNRWIYPEMEAKHTYAMHNMNLCHYPGTNNVGGYFHGTIYGNFMWDAKITCFGRMGFQHEGTDEWWGYMVRQWH